MYLNALVSRKLRFRNFFFQIKYNLKNKNTGGCEDGFCFMYGDVGFTPSIYMDGMHPLGTTVIYFCVQGFYLLEEKLENTTAVCDPTGYWTSQPNCAGN